MNIPDKIIEAKKLEVEERMESVPAQELEGESEEFCLPPKFVSSRISVNELADVYIFYKSESLEIGV